MKRWQKISVIAVILVLTAALATGLGIAVEREQAYKQNLDNLYKKSYYDAMDSIADVEQKLSKLSVSEGANNQRTLLGDVWLNSELTAVSLSQLAAKDYQMDTIIKFFNQTGDYCYYLANQVAKGTPLSEKDKDKLEKLYNIVLTLQENFAESSASVMNGGSFVGKLNEGIQLIGGGYDKFNNDSSVDYPEMIYDGPFSDGLSDREAKFLKGKEDISKEDAETIIKERFRDTTKLEFIGENSGSIPAYMYEVTWAEGNGNVQITKKGGVILEYSSYRQENEPTLSEQECQDKAMEKLEAMGFTNLAPVWVTDSYSSVYINFAYETDDIIFYPDLIQVKVSADNGDLLGLEAENYIYNHTGKRAIDSGIKSISQAKAVVSSRIKIESERLTVIPTEWNSEILAYEFSGSYNDGLYFVYIDAATIDEIKVMKVIERDGGRLIS